MTQQDECKNLRAEIQEVTPLDRNCFAFVNAGSDELFAEYAYYQEKPGKDFSNANVSLG